MERETLQAIVEAILVTARGPVTAGQIAEAVGEREVDPAAVEEVLEALRQDWDAPCRGLRVERVAGGWRCATPAQLEPYLRSFHGVVSRQRLSQAALEVLSIVAYRQPVTLPEINFLRGTNSAGVVRTLLERKLIRMAGRKQVVGKPFLYRTTREFLVHFGLERPEDLPDPEELVPGEPSVAADAGTAASSPLSDEAAGEGEDLGRDPRPEGGAQVLGQAAEPALESLEGQLAGERDQEPASGQGGEGGG